MKLEKQVCNLELSRKLKELGVEQDSLFYWLGYSEKIKGKRFGNKSWQERKQSFELHYGKSYQVTISDYLEDYSAFTVAELGEMLKDTKKDFILFPFHIKKDDSWGWEIVTVEKVKRAYSKTEADARAKMLIYLLENKLINLE